MGTVLCKISFIGQQFGISRFMAMIFRKFSRFMGILLRNSPDLWVVLLRFEWHNKLLPPPPGSEFDCIFCTISK